MEYFHKTLNNPRGLSHHFDVSRGFETHSNDDEKEETTKDYEHQKGILSASNTDKSFTKQQLKILWILSERKYAKHRLSIHNQPLSIGIF